MLIETQVELLPLREDADDEDPEADYEPLDSIS